MLEQLLQLIFCLIIILFWIEEHSVMKIDNDNYK